MDDGVVGGVGGWWWVVVVRVSYGWLFHWGASFLALHLAHFEQLERRDRKI